MGEGIVCVNAGGIVTRFNRKAKEITGIVLEAGAPIPPAPSSPGDIVLIADNMLGGRRRRHDGRRTSHANIRDPELRPGDAVLAAGVYHSGGSKPLYRRCGPYAMPQGCVSRACGGLEVRLSVSRYSC